jgi:transcriptional regulator with XRE-family HTH domain
MSPERAAALAEERRLSTVLEGLHKLREARGVSQEELARAWDTSQPNVSKIERQRDLQYSTIKRYVESLGGELRLLAVFPDEEVELRLDQTEVRPCETSASRLRVSSPWGPFRRLEGR